MRKMNALCFLMLFAMVLLQPALAVSEAHAGSDGSREAFAPFTCDMGFFKAEVPADWKLHEAITEGRIQKVYGFDVRGPQNPEGAYTSITVLYYGPDHMRFTSEEKFIRVNMDMSLALPDEKCGPLTPVTVAGRAGQEFVRNEFLFIPPYSVEPKKIPMRERMIVLPGEKGGFYTLKYSAPEDMYETYQGVFEQVLDSFQPNP